jgi:hypothetical protein
VWSRTHNWAMLEDAWSTTSTLKISVWILPLLPLSILYDMRFIQICYANTHYKISEQNGLELGEKISEKRLWNFLFVVCIAHST